MVEVPMSKAVVPPSMVTFATLASASTVVRVKAPVKALPVSANRIVPLSPVSKVVVPPIINSTASWVIFPVVAVTLRLASTALFADDVLINKSPAVLASSSKLTVALSTKVILVNVKPPPAPA